MSRLALLSLFAVFKDIVPGYRIRPPSEKELEVKVGQRARLSELNQRFVCSVRLWQLRREEEGLCGHAGHGCGVGVRTGGRGSSEGG